MYSMKTLQRRTKVSVTIPEAMVAQVDRLVKDGLFESRSAAFENATDRLLRAQMDALIEREVAKLNRDAEIAEAEEGMDDFSKLVRE